MVSGARVMIWANWRRGPNLAVPSPHDGDAGVRWWYDRIAELAQGWAAAGITDVLFPQPLKTNAGAYPGADGYGVFDDYDIGSKNTLQFGGLPTRFGTAEQLRRAIAVCHANGLAVHVDHVMHQRIGGQLGTYRYAGADGITDNGRFPKHPGCFRGDPPRVTQDPVPDPPDDFSFGDELCPINAVPAGYVRDGLIEAGDWLFRTLGIQGARLDDMKGMAIPFVHDFITSKAMRDKFFFGEYASGNRDDTDWWVGQEGDLPSAIDFDFHYNMVQPMCNDAGSGGFSMGDLAGRGMIATMPMKAVPFVESMDSDTNGFATVVFNKLLGYALMLGGEGLPMIYARDYLSDPDCYGLGDAIDTLVWCNRMLASGGTVPRLRDDRLYVFERTGEPGLIVALNNDVWNPAWATVTIQTGHGPGTILHDYTGHNPQDCRVGEDGRATFGIPPGIDGRGYGFWAPAGLGTAVPVASGPTTQTFFGAEDLDTPPVANGTIAAGRIWCAGHTPIDALLTATGALDGGTVMVRIIGPDGAAIGTSPAHGGDGAVELHAETAAPGWHELAVEGHDLPRTGTPFELAVSYHAPQRFAA